MTYDEAFDPDGAPRAHYARVMEFLAAEGPAEVQRRVDAETDRLGETHGAGDEAHRYPHDAVPRILTADEWRRLEAGVRQRVRALERFVADAYGERTAVAEGVVPEEVVTSSPSLERDLLDLGPEASPAVWIRLAGPDIVRTPEGEFVVLEDNVRTPTLMAHAVAARRAVLGAGFGGDPGAPVAPVDAESLAALVRWTLEDARGGRDGAIVLLDDPEATAVAWEGRQLAAWLGIPFVAPADLRSRRGRVELAATGEPVAVVWRRTPEERLRDDDGRPTAVAELLLEPMLGGTVAVVNAFGTGVADDKRLHPYVDDLVRHFLGEEPLVRSLPGFDLADEDRLADALGRLDELVVKPRSGSGGFGVLIGRQASEDELAAARREIEADPAAYLVQEAVSLSQHPTVVDGELAPRHLDLRPFAFQATSGEVRVLPGGLSRYAPGEGELVINAAQGGGGKDTWVLQD